MQYFLTNDRKGNLAILSHYHLMKKIASISTIIFSHPAHPQTHIIEAKRKLSFPSPRLPLQAYRCLEVDLVEKQL